MEFGKEPKNNGKVSPISMHFHWKTDKKSIDKLSMLEEAILDKDTTPDEKVLYEKQINTLKENKFYGFISWNKELKLETRVMPEEFILLSTTNCLEGRDNATNNGIYSNQVVNLKNEILTAVCVSGGRVVYSDLYNKEKAKECGLKFTKGLIVLEGDNIIEYYLNGSPLMKFNEDLETIDWRNNKICIDRVDEVIKGNVKYYIPRRKEGSKITDAEREEGIRSRELLEDYRKPNGD